MAEVETELPEAPRSPLFLKQISLGDIVRLIPAFMLIGVMVNFAIEMKVDATRTDDRLAAAISEMQHAVEAEAATRSSHEAIAQQQLTNGLASLASKIDTNQVIVNQQLQATTEKLGDLRAILVDVVNASTPSRKTVQH